MNSLKFSHIGMSCQDPIRIEKFYSKYFGFKRSRVIPGDDPVVFIQSGAFAMELFRSKESRPTPAVLGAGQEYPGVRHFSFQVDNVDAKLAEIGADARITLGPFNFDEFIPGWRTVWIADPENNIVEITQGYVDEINPPALVE